MAEVKKAKENQGSLAARAWDATKEEGDPDFDNMPNLEQKGKLEFAAERVKATGIAQTNFEHKVKELAEQEAEENKGEGPMAVVSPDSRLGGAAVGGEGPMSTAPVAGKSQGQASKAKGKGASKGKGKAQSTASRAKASAKKAAKKTDQSGHVPTDKEKAAIAAAEKDAPQRP
jgi:hypothetical protein